MAHKFNKGDSIFFLFKKGKTVQDSQRKPRFYLTRDKAEMYLPFGDEIIEDAPVRHGRWLDNEFYMFCSVCGMQWYYCDNETQDFKFCPHCGCKMDGDDDATN